MARSHRKSLSSGRPPTTSKRKVALSAAATRTIIRSHHRLHKRLQQAQNAKDEAQVSTIQGQIADLGGLESYQQASILGQAKDRGGDSSTVLMQWLETIRPQCPGKEKLRLLEVGALSVNNACSNSKLFEIERIDLNSQGAGILQQDFMQRPLPRADSNEVGDTFDVISLSLVVNYVPDAAQRGAMLQRTCRFLRSSKSGRNNELSFTFPALFLVLPAACVFNSRYLNEERLAMIMESLGYSKSKQKRTAKLVYYLWHYDHSRTTAARAVPKKEVNPGSGRNNFAIVLEGGQDVMGRQC